MRYLHFIKNYQNPVGEDEKNFPPKAPVEMLTITPDSFKLKFGKREGLSENDQCWFLALQRGPIGKEATSSIELAA